MKKRFYIAGPMTGYKNYNAGAFLAAEKYLRKIGHEAVNPAAMAELHTAAGRPLIGETLRRLMADELSELCRCDGVLLLDGWEKSAGARRELEVALAIGLEVIVSNEGNLYGVKLR